VKARLAVGSRLRTLATYRAAYERALAAETVACEGDAANEVCWALAEKTDAALAALRIARGQLPDPTEARRAAALKAAATKRARKAS
jgi:hypothetical protein